ncbi:dTMP kinase [Sinomonas humi]|uniref:Thymidylate kinase n=1 Tax=Sinomonas humi TaxID=1338436 RepID=A0A0B2AFH1_9MICC|nr:dTMP kinase [Sinomonas humi]KHL01980.1 thymidylate kinase [Sinomonas humi]
MTSSPYSPTSEPDRGHPRGLFVAFEGGDGAGKSTQARLLAGSLLAAGHEVLLTREPGGTPIGEKLRSLVLEHGQGEVDARTEALIFAAARAAHVAQTVKPALDRGSIVITDRYIGSSIVYQGIARGLGAEPVRDLNVWATEGLWPDLTVLLDVDETEGRARRAADDAVEDRLESESDDFHRNVRTAFLDLAEERPDAYLVLDGRRPLDELAERILAAVTRSLQARL